MRKNKTRTMVMVALLAAFTAILAPHTIPIGPIPLSLGLFAIAFTACMLPPLPALCSLGVYVVLGLVGLPVFTGYRGGPAVLVGPTGGYIFGYFLLVMALSLAAQRLRRLPLQMLAGAAGLAACYALGTLWYMLLTGSGLVAALAACVAPFVVPDLLKILCALLLAKELGRRMKRQGGTV